MGGNNSKREALNDKSYKAEDTRTAPELRDGPV